MSRYAIGIDLGTTHSALSWVDLQTEGMTPEILPIAQQSGPGAVQDFALLPSFLYMPHLSELATGDLALPWNAAPDRIIGEWARSHGALTPIRLVSSAKSWLGHAGVDRRAGILPADAPIEVERISPLAASTHYLQHLRDAWNHCHPEAPFDQQAVTVTIPASFDPAARELTAEAAQAAGYQGITLLEEPQAALYSWIAGSAGDWRKQVQVGDVILVIDVGGGTSDFSLIAVTEDAGNLQLNRVAVGEHILLGGDNMDLALAHGVARDLAAEGKQLDPWQMRALIYACRLAKEQLLSDPDLQSVPGGRAQQGLQTHWRLDQDRVEARSADRPPPRWLFPGRGEQRSAREPPACRTHADRPALCAGCCRHTPLGRTAGPPARRHEPTAGIRTA